MSMEGKRLTLPNPGGSSLAGKTYRLRASNTSFRMECQQGDIWFFGDLINKLGRLEDLEEELRRRNRA